MKGKRIDESRLNSIVENCVKETLEEFMYPNSKGENTRPKHLVVMGYEGILKATEMLKNRGINFNVADGITPQVEMVFDNQVGDEVMGMFRENGIKFFGH